MLFSIYQYNSLFPQTKETPPQIPGFASSFFSVPSKQKSESHTTNGIKQCTPINQATPSTTKLPGSVVATPSHHNSQPYPLGSICAKYEPISPIQVSHVTSKVSPVHIKHTKQTSSKITPVHIQSAQVSTSSEKLPLVAADVKSHCKPGKRKRQDTDPAADNTSYKRGRHNEPLNHQAIMIMVEWYNGHRENPYPNKQDKLKMATEGGITVSQVKSWFANKRNRSNNTRPKVEKQHLQERLLTICHSLSKDGQHKSMDNSFVIQQLSSLINSAKH